MEFVQRNGKLKGVFANKQSMNMIYDFYKNLTSLYTEEYARVNGEEYNKMIKQEIDDALLERLIVQMARYGAGNDVKK